MILILLFLCIISDGFLFRSRLGILRDYNRNKIFFARILGDDDEKFSIMDKHLNEELERLLEIIPIYPKNEDEINEDSMEGYLRDEFKKICDKDENIDFEKYYLWRKEKGTFLEKNDVLDVFNSVVERYNECKLMEFIEITRIIDDDFEF